MSRAGDLRPKEPERATPFLKWVGGKGQLLREILPRLPRKFDTYYEPFVGGGAVFFALASERRFQRAVLSDRNPDLIELYRIVRDHVGELIRALAQHAREATNEAYYYALRALTPSSLLPIERASRMIYLNKTCFNGLYRVNKKGEFNVPFGRYSKPRVLNEEVLRSASAALACTELVVDDFESVLSRAKKRDAVYFDPPYHPISATSSFTAYGAHPFRDQEQKRLSQTYRELCARGIAVLLSNSDCVATRDLYQGHDIHTVSATRAINSVATKRGPVNEILVVHAPKESRRSTQGQEHPRVGPVRTRAGVPSRSRSAA